MMSFTMMLQASLVVSLASNSLNFC